MKKPIKMMLITLISIVVLGLLVIGAILVNGQKSAGFLKGTTLNGEDISGKRPERIVQKYANSGELLTIQINEKGEPALSGTLAEFGYTFDADAMQTTLEEAMAKQKESLGSVFRVLTSGDELTIDKAYAFDETVFDAKVTAANLAQPRVASVDAALKLDESTNKYVVTEAVQGNEIDDAALQATVKDAIDAAMAAGQMTGTLTIEIPEEDYSSKAVSIDLTALQQEAEKKNKELLLAEYKQMVITYDFGEEKVELTSDTFMDWLTLADNGVVTVNSDEVAAYVSELAAKYDTRYQNRTFYATGGQTISFNGADVEYGYTINQEKEAALLEKNLADGQSVEREPEYDKANSYGNPYFYARNGVDDLNGTYVEIDLTAQHLWFYVDGALVVESDIVTGDVAKNQQTKTGIFPLAYKESPSTLKGANYEVEVEYWMPFFEGQGLHDASWRTAFGGEIYKANGSNGCVNLPPAVAEAVFENIHAGLPIVIYNEDSSSTPASSMTDAAKAVDEAAAAAQG